MLGSAAFRGNLTLATVITLLAVIAGLMYFIFREDVSVRKFTGSVTGLTEDTLTLTGVYYAPREPGGVVPQGQETITFKVDGETYFYKFETAAPDMQAIMAQGGVSSPDDLPTTEGEGSLLDLGRSLSLGHSLVELEFRNPRAPGGLPIATNVIYRVMLAPVFEEATPE